MLDIFAPINSLEEAEKLIQLGADELYCGVNPDEWADKYENVKTPNRRANERSQVGSLEELRRISDLCHENNVLLYVTLNAHFYSERQAAMLQDLVEQLSSWEGITGYIVSDVHFMSQVSEAAGDDEILVSTGSTVFNGRTAAFLEDVGADGIHLPRHLTIAEIEELSRNAPDSLDLYAFVLNMNCVFIDGNCEFLHNPPVEHEDARRVPCFQTFTQQRADGGPEELAVKETGLFPTMQRTRGESCGLCSLYRFDQIGLSGIKMVGRLLPLSRKAKDVQLLETALEELQTASSEDEFKENIQEIVIDRGRDCDIDACYYPTVMEQ